MMARPVLSRPGSISRGRLPGASVVTALALMAAALGLTPSGASADRAWCRTDPVVAIGSELADVIAAAPPEAPLLVTGPNRVAITVPVGVDAWLVLSDLGFGKGVETTFAESPALRATATGIEVRVALYVPATDDTMPVRLEFAPGLVGLLHPASAEGTANDWVRLTTTL